MITPTEKYLISFYHPGRTAAKGTTLTFDSIIEEVGRRRDTQLGISCEARGGKRSIKKIIDAIGGLLDGIESERKVNSSESLKKEFWEWYDETLGDFIKNDSR